MDCGSLENQLTAGVEVRNEGMKLKDTRNDLEDVEE